MTVINPNWNHIIHLSSLTQIIEDVQNFYATTYNENNNSTLIMSYQKIVSKKCNISMFGSVVMQKEYLCFHHIMFFFPRSAELLWNHSKPLP